jgi:tRNA1Val (adenine37-N6)-methyltransferase
MNKAPFQFKQFKVVQNKCAMKVNTDGVLLGAWQQPDNARHILDIGTGTGVIALMMAQKNPTAQIHAIDIDADAYLQAKENFEQSPWGNRLTPFHTSLQDFSRDAMHRVFVAEPQTMQGDAMHRVFVAEPQTMQGDATHRVSTATKYDLIICNPPYFIDDQKTESHRKNIAKHSVALNYADLLSGLARLLTVNGKALLVLPAFNFPLFETEAAPYKLFVSQATEVIAVSGKAPYLMLLQIERNARAFTKSSITIQDSDGNFTRQYKALTRDFYLKF